jgi:hypothetical protein
MELEFMEVQILACFGSCCCKNNQKFAFPSKTLPLSNLSRFSKTSDSEIGISKQQLADFSGTYGRLALFRSRSDGERTTATSLDFVDFLLSNW